MAFGLLHEQRLKGDIKLCACKHNRTKTMLINGNKSKMIIMPKNVNVIFIAFWHEQKTQKMYVSVFVCLYVSSEPVNTGSAIDKIFNIILTWISCF